MKKGFMLLLLLALTGCAKLSNESMYYRLQGGEPPEAVVKKIDNNWFIWLEPVVISDFLSSPGIVYQTGEVNYTAAKNNLWATPLNFQLSEMVINTLNATVSGMWVSSRKESTPAVSIRLTIRDFQGRHDGNVVVSGEWIIRTTTKNAASPSVKTKYFTHVVEQPNDGYTSLVETLSATWQDEIKSLIPLLNQ